MNNVMRDVLSFILELTWGDIPNSVRHMARRCILDLSGTMAAGAQTEMSGIAREASASALAGDEATILFDGRRASLAGAAFANGMTIDSMDMHDGHRPAKGHAGACVYPAALATAERAGWSGEQLATALVIGYEISLRAALSLHQTACDYHTSGAWAALGASALTARGVGLNADQAWHALGIAEYYGPRSPMMRVIDTPSMLKDGSGWGSMTGVITAQLAAAGLSGAPAATLEGDEVRSIWDDLGQRWHMNEIYFKPFACCRWAQPAVKAAMELTERHRLEPADIASVTVHTFEAATHLGISHPRNTEEAQYSLPYPLAAALFHGRLDPIHVLPPLIFERDTLELADRIALEVDAALEARFPKQALAAVTVRTIDGRTLQSTVHPAPGDAEAPLTDDDLQRKFDRITRGLLPRARALELREACWHCDELDSASELLLIMAPPLSTGPTVHD